MKYNSFDYASKILNNLTHRNFFGCVKVDQLDRKLLLVKDWLYGRCDLPNTERELIIFRYARLVKRIRNMYLSYSWFYTFSTLFTSIVALVVTALISLNKMEEAKYSTIAWWFSWILSLAISIVNTLATFYKWDRKYLLLLQIYNKLEQEIWMYMGLIGPYANMDDEEQPTHASKVRIFLARIELANKRLNDNMLDIEESDQDDREMLRRKVHGVCPPGDIDCDEDAEIHNMLKSSAMQDELNADLAVVGEKEVEMVEQVKDEDK
jgi:hypothetical protein